MNSIFSIVIKHCLKGGVFSVSVSFLRMLFFKLGCAEEANFTVYLVLVM